MVPGAEVVMDVEAREDGMRSRFAAVVVIALLLLGSVLIGGCKKSSGSGGGGGGYQRAPGTSAPAASA
jgi:hypothetical protein